MSATPLEPDDRRIPIGLLDEPTKMSRLEIRDEDVEELAADIRARGLINPIAVVPNGDRYRIIAGHTRYLACQRVGLVTVRCSVYPTDEAAAEGIKFAENRFRRDLTPAEEAVWFDELLEGQCGGDVDTLCALLKAKRSYVEGRLLLLHGDEQVFDALRAGKITVGVAHKLNEISHELERRYYLDAAVRGGATVAVVTGWVAEWKARQTPNRGTSDASAAPPQTGVVYAHEFDRCYICRKADPRYIPMPINVHEHCRIATLDPLLETFHGDDVAAAQASDPRRI